MEGNPFTQFVFQVFLFCAIVIIGYTCNFYYLAFLSSRRKDENSTSEIGEPTITIQLPIYNEKYVATRLVDAVCAQDYPKEKMRIMVLDDSDDDTVNMMHQTVLKYQSQGFDISHVRRGTRQGYKAGALKHAMKSTTSDFVAIFDADFIPPEWYLKKAIPHFTNSKIGLIQCRWGHVNENYSALTQAQALNLDFHFLVEQKAKSNSHLFMNFNGTAGIWRKECIDDAGGWHTATLVEDLDLSYRAQMKGWKCLFLPDIVVDAELPVQMNGAKRQQFRWAKGSIQCAIKLLGSILLKRKIAFDAKLQAFIQLTRHIVFPLMLIQFITLPILLASEVNLYIVSFLPAVTLATYLAMGPGAYLLVIHKMYKKNWKTHAKALPYLLVYSIGMSVNNTVAVFDGVIGKKNEFLRTPKYGIVKNDDDWRDKAYNLPFTKTTLLELFFAVYGILGIFIAIFSNNPIFAPIIGLQAVGFFYIALISFSHTRFKRPKFSDHKITKEEKMANNFYKLALGGIFAIIVIGGYMSFVGYSTDVYPIDMSVGLLDRTMASSDPQSILLDLNAIKGHLPANGNPVWIFPTDTTNFVRIQTDLDTMIISAEKITAVPTDSAAYHTGITDIRERAEVLQENLADAIPYMYVSFSNIIFSSIWIAALLAIFAVLNKKKQQMNEYDLSKDV
ncbi:MAG TPA: cellulose synthase family protein [Candidatus Nitrosopelagicus sp.]|jgi:cellulose synthase/poly-beta-1,6-N-acetylglucosamine synthase-like glycosyltransferase|nr:cellulose synthase family protein [Candidatus Nitrosopelagicus sp.]